MITNDATLVKIKHEVLYQVAKLVFEGKLEEEKEQLPYKMIPGPRARYRCCIYKEREVIRQRINLAQGKCPDGSTDNNIVQVLTVACEGCPISRYVVTDNCRKCMGKACQQACKFGAISMTRDRSYIDPEKCKECGMCAKACPYNAIADLVRPCKKSCPTDAITMDENDICVIDEKKCIRCGQCIHSCPFGAIGSKTDLVPVIEAIKSGKRVIALLAPATEGQFGKDITMASWKTALKKVGFSGMFELGLGGDMTAHYEAKEWAEAYKEGKKMTTSCCPAFVNLIQRHFPEALENMSTTVSPMCAVSRMVKASDPDAITVFIGPCIAKKSEAHDHKIEGNADYVLTFGEIRAIIKAKEVELLPEENSSQESSIYGKRFGNGGGVTAAVKQSLNEMGENSDISVMTCSGAMDCKKALMLLKLGKLQEDFIEGMVCVGGCVGGPSKHKGEVESKKARDILISEADTRTIKENLSNYDMESFSMHR